MATSVPDAIRPKERPTKVRYWVVFFAVTLSIVTYIDRVALSLTQKNIAKDLNISDKQMGLVFGAFAVAYALFEIPSGFMGDRMGPRRVLMRIVLWWSAFTALTGAAFNFMSLFTTQLLFGAGEAGCFPNITRAFSTWLPRNERVRAQGIIWLSARWGGAFTPLLLVGLFRFLTWRQAFAAFGLLGVIWAIGFFVWFRDRPAEKAGLNEAELELLRNNPPPAPHAGMPWRMFLRSKTILLLCAQYFVLSFSWYFLITWFPTFVDERFHVNVATSTMLKVMPLFFCGLGSLFCGFIFAPLSRWVGSVKKARRLLAITGFFGASMFTLLAAFQHEALYAVLAVALANFCNDLVMPTSWGTVMDVSHSYSGTIAGAMNMMGNLGGALYGPVTGFLLNASGHNWNYVLFMGSGVYFTGIFIWAVLDPVTPIQLTESE